MSLITDAEIEKLTARFMDRTLPKSEWTHRAHFAAALHLLAAEDLDARSKMPEMIRAYNEATGVANTDTEGYHETITTASLHVAAAMLRKAPPGTSLVAILDALMESKYGRSDWLLEYWSHERLFSVEARRSWIAPDLAAFPFGQVAP